MRLLPTPVVSFADVTIGDPAAPDVAMQHFRAEIELAPLLKGEVRVIHMTVDRPRFSFDLAGLAADRRGAANPGWRLDPERISLARLEIVGGTAAITDSRAGREWRADDIRATVEASSLRGPARIDASFMTAGRRLDAKLALGRAVETDEVAAKLSVSSPELPLTLSTDGLLSANADAAPAYTGTLTIVGPPQPEQAEGEGGETAARSPWADFRASAAFELTPEMAAVTEAQLSYGGLERPLILQGSGNVALGAEPRFDLSIEARQVDLDRTLGGGAESPLAVTEAVDRLVAMLPSLPRPSIDGLLRLGADGLVVGGSVIQGVRADLATAESGWRVQGLAATLPGETRVELDGSFNFAGGTEFVGRGRLASRRPAALAAWWRGQAGSAVALERFAVEGDLQLGPSVQRLSELSATTGGNRITGAVELRRFEQSGEIFADVALAADRADLDELRALADLFGAGAVTSGEVDQMALVLSAEVLQAGGTEARSVALDGRLEGGELRLNRLGVGDLAGASLEARGTIRDPFGVPAGRLDASLSAADMTGAAAFLAELLPANPAVAHLQRVAPMLSPVAAEVALETGGTAEPLALDVAGSFGGTNMTLSAGGQGSLADLRSLNGSARLHVDSEDTQKVLAQIGLPVLPVRAGPLRIDADFRGGFAAPGTLQIDGTVAGVRATYAAETTPVDGSLNLAGDFEAEAIDIDPALLLAGFAAPGLGEGHAASAAGRLEIAGRKVRVTLSRASFDGEPFSGALEASLGEATELSGSLEAQRLSLPALAGLAAGGSLQRDEAGWSDSPFASPLPPGLTLDLRLSARELELGLPHLASEAKLNLALADGVVNIDLLESGFVGGKLSGAIAGSAAEGVAQASIRAALQGGSLDPLVWRSGGLPVASGLVDLSFDVTGNGRSMAAFVSTLAGSGSFAIAQGRFNTVNLDAITAVMEAGEAAEDPSLDQARETFAIMFGAGALPFGSAAGSFAVAGGVVNVATVSITAGDSTVLADATVDLNHFTLASEWTLRHAEPGAPADEQPFVRVHFSGPIAEPGRRFELEPLVDLIRSRNLQRRLDELEALETERRRLEALRDQTEARLAAEEAEAERRAAEQREGERLGRELRRLEGARPGTPQALGAPTEPSAPLPAPPPGAPPDATAGVGAPLQLVPAPAPQSEPPLDLIPRQDAAAEPPAPDIVRQIGPVIQDFIRGGAAR